MFLLPHDIKCYIYEFDSTFKIIFDDCLQELKSKQLNIGDSVMLNESLVNRLDIPKYRCFRPLQVTNIYESVFNTPWIEVDYTFFYRKDQLKKIVLLDGIYLYYHFLTKMFSFHHSRLLYDFDVNDIVMFDLEGFRVLHVNIRQYTKYEKYFNQPHRVTLTIDQKTVYLENIGVVQRIFLKLHPTSEIYSQEYDKFIDYRQISVKNILFNSSIGHSE